MNVIKKESVMNQNIIKTLEAEQIRTDLPSFNVGDTVRVHLLVREGKRERTQIFEGTVMKRQNGGINESFTVRKMSYGCGVEKTLQLNSPKIQLIEVVREGKVRRARLNYLKGRTGKAAKVKEKKKY